MATFVQVHVDGWANHCFRYLVAPLRGSEVLSDDRCIAVAADGVDQRHPTNPMGMVHATYRHQDTYQYASHRAAVATASDGWVFPAPAARPAGTAFTHLAHADSGM